MLRGVGAGCLIMALGLLGERAAQLERRRLGVVEATIVALTVLEAEIGYLSSDLREAFAHAAHAAPAASGLFLRAADLLAEGRGAAQAWSIACQLWVRQCRLPQRYLMILEGLAAAWGTWQAADCVRHIHLAQQLLRQEQERMRATVDNTCRLWRYLGVSGGLVLVILLY